MDPRLLVYEGYCTEVEIALAYEGYCTEVVPQIMVYEGYCTEVVAGEVIPLSFVRSVTIVL